MSPRKGVKVMNDCMNGGGGLGAGDDERGLGEMGEKRRDRDLGQIPRVLAKQTTAKRDPWL